MRAPQLILCLFVVRITFLLCDTSRVSAFESGLPSDLTESVKSSIDRSLRWLWSRQEEDGSWQNDAGLTGLLLKGFAESPRRYREKDGPYVRRASNYLLNVLKEGKAEDGSALRISERAKAVLGLKALGNDDYEVLIRLEVEKFRQLATQDSSSPGLGDVAFLLMTVGPTEPNWNLVQTTSRVLAECSTENSAFAVQFGEDTAVGAPTAIGSYTALRAGLVDLWGTCSARLPEFWGRDLQLNRDEGSRLRYHFLYFLAEVIHQLEHSELTVEGLPSRSQLVRHVLELQQPEGFWVNAAEGWQEEDPVFATVLAVLALERMGNANS